MIEVIIEDDATDEAKAVAAATKLIDQDKVVAIIGATGTGQTMAMRGDVDKAGIPQVSMAGGTAITSNFDPLVFQTPWSNNLVVPFELAYMKKQGITKIALITDTGGFGKDGLAVLQAAAPKAGIEIVDERDVQPRRHRHDRAAHQDQGLRRAGLLVISAGKEAATVVKHAKELGVDDAALRHPRQRAPGVHRGRRRRGRGLHLRGRQDPAAGELRRRTPRRTRSRPTSSTATAPPTPARSRARSRVTPTTRST